MEDSDILTPEMQKAELRKWFSNMIENNTKVDTQIKHDVYATYVEPYLEYRGIKLPIQIRRFKDGTIIVSGERAIIPKSEI